jgi:uncharacterized delta-60 repeat protein
MPDLSYFVPKGMSLKRTYSNAGTQSLIFGTDGAIYTHAQQSDGKIVIGGIFYYYNTTNSPTLARIDPTSGDVDTTFATNIGNGGIGDVASKDVYAVAIQPDGKILVGGAFDYFNNYGTLQQGLVRLNSDGTSDTAFNANVTNLLQTATSNGYYVRSIALQSDGKIILGGSFDIVVDQNGDNRSAEGYCRLNSDGTFDLTFMSGGVNDGPNNPSVTSVVVQPDNKILLGGLFSSWAVSGTSYSVGNIVRLNANGTLDTTFTTALGTGTNGTVYAIALQSDGSVIFGGNFTSFNGTTCDIARVSSTGTFDTSFNTNVGTGIVPGAYIFSISVQSDGDILVGGNFTSWNGTSVGRIVRLNSDGTRDTAFTTANGGGSNNAYGQIRTVSQLSSGSIFVGGDSFDKWDSISVDNIVTLSSAGARNTTFLPKPEIVFAILAGGGGGTPDTASDVAGSGGGAGAVVMGLVPFTTSAVIGYGGSSGFFGGSATSGGTSRYSTLYAEGGAVGVADAVGSVGTNGSGGSGGSRKITSTGGTRAGGNGSTLFNSLGGAGGACAAPSSGDSIASSGGSGTSGGGGGAASYSVTSGTGTVTGGSGGSGLVGGGGGGAGTDVGGTAGTVTGGAGGTGLYPGGTATAVTGTNAYRYSSGGGGGGLLGAGEAGTADSGANNNRSAAGGAGGLGGGGAGGGVGDYQSFQGANGGNGCVLLYW